ncbi:hypothetical protein H8F21_20255 [Pseudomonas sp. P66]|uniref:Uncharacterized protein n=1 Tax=Pseudomonas arcuscaelestis TaxID=2710591 RepID=A0ABS2C1X3_9PSED|nr:hypothetical protein [Pseudomonas arcuscaelestis]MBM5459900.1 hypothetical protein [Pseudomonas arcuscaelestis]
MSASPLSTVFASAPNAVVVVRGRQQPAMISHYPPPVSRVVVCVLAPPGVVVLG